MYAEPSSGGLCQPIERVVRLDKGHSEKALMALGCLLQKPRAILHRLTIECPGKRGYRDTELVITKWWQDTAIQDRRTYGHRHVVSLRNIAAHQHRRIVHG